MAEVLGFFYLSNAAFNDLTPGSITGDRGGCSSVGRVDIYQSKGWWFDPLSLDKTLNPGSWMAVTWACEYMCSRDGKIN